MTVSNGQPDEAVETGGQTADGDTETPPETPEPEEKPAEPETPPEPQLSSLDVEIELPEGEGTVMVTVKVDGSTYLEYPVDKDRGTISFTIEGAGTKQMDVYFDGVLQQTRELKFGA